MEEVKSLDNNHSQEKNIRHSKNIETPKKPLSEKLSIHINAIDNYSNISELKNKLKKENDANINKKN